MLGIATFRANFAFPVHLRQDARGPASNADPFGGPANRQARPSSFRMVPVLSLPGRLMFYVFVFPATVIAVTAAVAWVFQGEGKGRTPR